MATAAGGTHPIGMHSCFLKSLFVTNQSTLIKIIGEHLLSEVVNYRPQMKFGAR